MDDPERNPDAADDSETAKSNPAPSTPPSIERDEDGSRGNSQGPSNHVAQNQSEPLRWTRYVEAFCAIALVLITGTYTYYAGGQLHTMRGQLDEMKRSGEQSTEQMWRAIEGIRWMAQSEDWTQKDAHQSVADSEIQSRAALQASIDNFRLDQRAWIGLKDIECTRCLATEDLQAPKATYPDGFPRFPAHITTWGLAAHLVNTGKTPAEDVHLNFTIHEGWIIDVPNIPSACTNPKSTVPCFPSLFDRNKFIDGGGKTSNAIFSISPVFLGVIAPEVVDQIVFDPQNSYHEFPIPEGAIPSVYVDGVITYKVKGGGTGITKFCFFPAPSIARPSDEKNYEYCDTPDSNTMH